MSKKVTISFSRKEAKRFKKSILLLGFELSTEPIIESNDRTVDDPEVVDALLELRQLRFMINQAMSA